MKAMDFLNWQADGGRRSQYVRNVTDALIRNWDITNSDAQGIVETQGRIVINCFNYPMGIEECALMVQMNCSEPDIS